MMKKIFLLFLCIPALSATADINKQAEETAYINSFFTPPTYIYKIRTRVNDKAPVVDVFKELHKILRARTKNLASTFFKKERGGQDFDTEATRKELGVLKILSDTLCEQSQFITITEGPSPHLIEKQALEKLITKYQTLTATRGEIDLNIEETKSQVLNAALTDAQVEPERAASIKHTIEVFGPAYLNYATNLGITFFVGGFTIGYITSLLIEYARYEQNYKKLTPEEQEIQPRKTFKKFMWDRFFTYKLSATDTLRTLAGLTSLFYFA